MGGWEEDRPNTRKQIAGRQSPPWRMGREEGGGGGGFRHYVCEEGQEGRRGGRARGEEGGVRAAWQTTNAGAEQCVHSNSACGSAKGLGSCIGKQLSCTGGQGLPVVVHRNRGRAHWLRGGGGALYIGNT